MYKVLKWVYNLGIRHERARIDNALRVELSQIHKRQADLYVQMRKSRDNEEETRRVWLEQELTERAQKFIDSIYSPQEDTRYYTSIMFPGDDNNGCN